MARFSLGREEDDGDEGSGPSSSRPSHKKQKLAANTPSSRQPLALQSPAPAAPRIGPPDNEELVEVEGEEIDEEESEYEVEAEDLDSDFEEEEDGEDEEFEDELEHRVVRANQEVEENQQVGANERPGRDGSISVNLTDPDVLDCPICLEHLSIPVFQCENGHVACSSCCVKIGNRCPSCSWPIGYNRCRAIEKVLESVKISCQNVKYGCREMLRYCNKHDHEKSCSFAPCSCPLLDCNYVNSSWRLYVHFGCKHLSSGKRFVFNCLFSVCLERNQRFLILQEKTEGIIFLVNNFGERLASSVTVVCIGPTPSRREFSYEITARDGETSIMLQGFVDSIPKWTDCPPARKFLLVPNHYTNASGQLKLEVCIRKLQ